MKWIFLLKFFIYGGIASYDYAIGSKWTLAWAMLAILLLCFYIIASMEEIINDIKNK